MGEVDHQVEDILSIGLLSGRHATLMRYRCPVLTTEELGERHKETSEWWQRVTAFSNQIGVNTAIVGKEEAWRDHGPIKKEVCWRAEG